MPRLEEKMKKIAEKTSEQLPDEALQVVRGHTRKLQEAGLADQAVGEGERAPGFALRDPDGATVRLGDLTDQGPVILSFYRGRW